jgi:seryl-tRNA(Sec) selenium transferase
MDKITTTIKREWLKKIANRTKRVEYRELKPYWAKRLSQVQVPFLLRLINGMQPNAPEITLMVTRVRKNSRSRQFELVLGKIVELKYWSVKFERPIATGKANVS